jgi:serine/threonine protein kinase
MKKCSTCGLLYEGDLCPKCVAGFAQRPTDPTAPPEELPLKPGQTFRGMEILDLLGRGGMGVVYKARQPALDRLVALKILPKRFALDPDFQGRFIREAKALGSLSHPNLVAVYDFGAEAGLFYFAMEFVDGVNLRQVLRDQKLPPEQALRIVPQLCDALEYAHAEGVVHRDIKPENIMLDKKGRVKIADFGLAKLVGTDTAQGMLTMTNMVMGTPHYMAPEQVENPKGVDHRADIYAIGVVFYEMLTGELPIGRFEPPSKKVQVDVRLDEVVLRALEKEPSRRYQKAGEIKEAVTRATSVGTDSYSPTLMTPVPSRKPSNLPLLVMAAVTVLAVAAAVFALAKRPSPAPSIGSAITAPPPAADGPVDLTRIHFGPEERPLNYRWLPVKAPARNPFPAKTDAELDELVRYCDALGLQNVARADLKQGYLAQWFNVSLLALESPIAERLERDYRTIAHLKNSWSHRQGPLLVLVFAARREYRHVFEDIVLKTRKKLGLPELAPDLPVENLRLGKDELPKEWSLLEEKSGPPLTQVFAAPKGEGTMSVQVWELPTPAAAEAQEKLLAGTPRPKVVRAEVIRAARSVAVLSHDTQHLGGAEKIAQNLRTWMGRPKYTFDTIVPTAAELPPGWSFEKAVTDPKAVLDELGLAEAKPADVKRAFHATLKPHGSLQVFEIPESKIKYSVENQLEKIGPAEQTDEYVVAVQAPDDPSLDALHNRMREKLGWDRNRPRYIKMADARLGEKDLPPGLALKPVTAEANLYTADLTGGLRFRARGFQDYRLLETYADEEAEYEPGHVLLIKDFIVVHVSGPESAWPVFDQLEAALRKKMRMDPPSIEDLLHGRGLPNGQLLQEPAAVKDFATKQKLDASLVKAVWRLQSDTISAWLLEAKDEKAGTALPGNWKKGPFVASVKALDGAVAEDVKKVSEALRGRLRAK